MTSLTRFFVATLLIASCLCYGSESPGHYFYIGDELVHVQLSEKEQLLKIREGWRDEAIEVLNKNGVKFARISPSPDELLIADSPVKLQQIISSNLHLFDYYLDSITFEKDNDLGIVFNLLSVGLKKESFLSRTDVKDFFRGLSKKFNTPIRIVEIKNKMSTATIRLGARVASTKKIIEIAKLIYEQRDPAKIVWVQPEIVETRQIFE